MFMREVEDVVKEFVEDSKFKGRKHYRFKAEPIKRGE
jgi:hypothetical protein